MFGDKSFLMCMIFVYLSFFFLLGPCSYTNKEGGLKACWILWHHVVLRQHWFLLLCDVYVAGLINNPSDSVITTNPSHLVEYHTVHQAPLPRSIPYTS